MAIHPIVVKTFHQEPKMLTFDIDIGIFHSLISVPALNPKTSHSEALMWTFTRQICPNKNNNLTPFWQFQDRIPPPLLHHFCL